MQRSRVLYVAPHMDDEVIPCGGTLLLHQDQGSAVRVVFASDSSSGVADPALARQLAQARFAEMEQVRAAMRFQSVEVYGFPDGSLVRHEAALAERLAEDIRGFRPELLFCPFPVDGHADHQACALAVTAAMRSTGWKGDVFAYEVWSPLWANAAVDIGAVTRRKEELIRLYASQMADRDYATATLALNRFRGLQHRVQHAEAFHVCRPAEFQALTECLETLS